MNAKHTHQLIILGILLTLIALNLHQYLPKKTMDLLNDPSFSNFIYSTNNEQGEPLAFWINEPKKVWGCKVSETLNQENYHTCSLGVRLTAVDAQGIDLSDFSHFIVDVSYEGKNESLRIFLRNFNSIYSTIEDTNSTKFHSVRVEKQDLTVPVSVQLNEFSVADWWLRQYKIPRKHSARELSNVLFIGIDFEDVIAPGLHQFHLKQFVVTGDWISRDRWYLLIISPWLASILFYAIYQLRLLRARAKEDNLRILQLAQQNNKLKQQSDEFHRLSMVDSLTQCFNRFGVHHIINSLDAVVFDSSSSRYALIMIDIDYFKRINDRRGHDAGDRVLQAVGEMVQERIRKTDYLGRWGGEEFIVVLPNTRKEFALALAEKLRLIIFDTVFELNNPLNVTASFGITEQRNNEDFATTFKRVDKALYVAKNQGRNCCVLAEEEII